MSDAHPAKRWLLIAIPLLLIIAWFAWRYWQGPELAGYQLEERPLVQRVVASGEVASQSLAQVGSEITGVVKARHVREGDSVKAGDLLLELRDEELQARLSEAQVALQQLSATQRPQAQAALREAQSNLAQAIRERERRDQLYARQMIAIEQREQARQIEASAQANRDRAQLTVAALAAGGIDEQLLQQRLAAASAALEKTRIRAQVDGIVQKRAVEPGDLVQPGRSLLTIARIDSREIIVPLDEKDLAPVAVGQSAWVIADAFPLEILKAKVSLIAPAIDPSRGTIDIHLDLQQSADFLRQGMTVSVDIRTGRREHALVLPNDALHNRRGTEADVLRVTDGKVERVPVELGMRGTGLTEIIAGLKAGDKVLIDKAEEGQRIRLRLEPMMSDHQAGS